MADLKATMLCTAFQYGFVFTTPDLNLYLTYTVGLLDAPRTRIRVPTWSHMAGYLRSFVLTFVIYPAG